MNTTNFTKKEALLVKTYELANELNALEGKEPRYNVEALVGSWRFQKEVKEARVDDLKRSVENYTRLIEKQKVENEKKAKIEAYYATPEGAERKEKLEAKLNDIGWAFETQKYHAEVMFREWISVFLGRHWSLKRACPGCVTFGIWDEDKAEFVFGSEIEVSYDKYDYWKKGEKFETNVGSMGTFDLCDTKVGTRARFYIDLGRFLMDKEKLAELKTMCFAYTDKIEELRAEAKAVRDELDNPLEL